jgi:hypothetical protein
MMIMRRLPIFALSLLLAFLISGRGAAAQESETLTILDVMYEETFPEVQVKLLYLDEQDSLIEDMDDFQVTLGGQPVNDLTVSTERGPLAVSMVTDISARMSDKGNTLRDNRFQDMQKLLQNQLLKLQLPDIQASLVVLTQTETLYYPMSEDIGGLVNIVKGAVPDKPFAVPQSEAEEAGDYPLQAAILMGLEQFEELPEDMPRALFVFASGDADTLLDMEEVQSALASHNPENAPLSVTLVTVGSDDEELSFPANPEMLQRVAEETGGEHFHYFAQNIEAEAQLEEDIQQRFEQMLQQATYYVLRFEGDETLVGTQEMEVQAGTAEASRAIDIKSVPPRVDVVVDSRNWQDEVQMKIEPLFVQSELEHVEYLLDNRRIAQSEAGGDFAYTIDAYADAFQQQFPPGEYELVAAVRDTQGEVNRSTPLTVRVFERPAPATFTEQLTAVLGSYGLYIAPVVVLLLVLVGGFVFMRSRTQKGSQSNTFRQRGGIPAPHINEEDHDPTRGVEEDGENEETQMVDGADDLTQVYDDDLTRPFVPEGGGGASGRAVRLVVLEGLSEQKHFPLQGNASYHYFIGRPPKDGGKQPDIVLNNGNVSRDHAKLVVLTNGDVQLIALPSVNGTFVGEEQNLLAPNTSHTLSPGDVFWISPAVKLRLEEG